MKYRLSFVLSVCQLSQMLMGDIFVPGSASGGKASAITFPEWYTFLQKQSKDTFDVQMGLMYVTASDGDEFYNFEEDASPRCHRIAQTTMTMYLNLSTFKEITHIQDKVLSDIFEVAKNTKQQFEHPLELFCNETEKQMLRHPNTSSVYSRVSKSVNTGSWTNRRRYFSKIFSSQQQLANAYSNFFKIPGFVKATMQEQFTNQANESEAYNSTYNVLARAIIEVAKKGEYPEKIEKIQKKVLSEIGSLMENAGNIFENFLDDSKTLQFTLTMMDKYETYFNQDSDLQKELAAAKKIIESSN